MHIVHVHIHVKPEFVEDFIHATRINAKSSIKEPGVARFDVIQDLDDPSRHKETAHYRRWRDIVAEMMTEPRKSIKFVNLYPDNGSY